MQLIGKYFLKESFYCGHKLTFKQTVERNERDKNDKQDEKCIYTTIK